jgi:hypothetical protein
MTNGGSSWGEVLKTVLQSQVGGWVIACVVFAFVMHRIVLDRASLLKDLQGLRDKAMPSIVSIEQTTLRNEKLLQRIADKIGIDENEN